MLHFYNKCSISVQTQYKHENSMALGQQNKPHSLLFKLVKLYNQGFHQLCIYMIVTISSYKYLKVWNIPPKILPQDQWD